MTQHESLNGKTEANDANPVSAPESNPKSGNLKRLKVIIIAVSVCAAGAIIVLLLTGKTPVSPSSLPLQDRDTTTATVQKPAETASWETEYEHLIEEADIYYSREDYISAKMEYQKALSKIPANDASDKRDAMTKKIADCEQGIKAEKEGNKQ